MSAYSLGSELPEGRGHSAFIFEWHRVAQDRFAIYK